MMNSAQKHECVFCKESFDDKETLQVHFRKHADPSFKNAANRNGKPQNEPAISKDSSNKIVEMVSCDVCTEEFTTISKAITHKHKMHPDHDAKYFCPLCGKLFTMKHLFNKHMAQHETMETTSDELFHCDSCSVEFNVPSAMIYHNKHFHRQDTELPIIGHSKKQKFVNQELIPLYYCAFCGEEYINKVNLHNHMSNDHGDENQSPDEVFRCPLCQAIFYHLDAYEIHLTFHSVDDIYNGKDVNETACDLTEFTLESVPPTKEKVEEYEPQEEVKGSEDTMDIDQLLNFAANDNLETESEIPTKHKKHKKRKKSKKSSITLDEFLNMNTDVFGEDLSFQGIEVVPEKVVNKRLKAKAKSDIEKLKQQGIVVKVKSANKVNVAPGVKILPGTKIGKPDKTANDPKQGGKNTINTMKVTTNDALSKLLNQSQNQIKIIKKANHTQTQEDSVNQGLTIRAISSKTNNLDKKGSDTPEKIEVQCDLLLRSSEPSSELDAEENVDITPSSCKMLEKPAGDKNDDDGQGLDIDNDVNQIDYTQSIEKLLKDKETIEKVSEGNNHESNDKNNSDSLEILKNISKHLIVKSSRQSTPEVSANTDENSSRESNTCRQFVLVDNKKTSFDDIFESGDLPQKLTEKQVKSDEGERLGGNTCNLIKKLGQQMTIKSINRTIRKPETNDERDDEEINKDDEPAHTTKSNKHISKVDESKVVGDVKPSDAFFKLSQQITIKAVKKTVDSDNDEELDDADTENFEKEAGLNTQFVQDMSTLTKSDNTLKNLSQNISVKSVNAPITKKDTEVHNSGAGETQINIKTGIEIDLLKGLGHNITVKSPKTLKTKDQEDEDDSEKVEPSKGKEIVEMESCKDSAAKQTVQALQKLSQNLTIKSTNKFKLMQDSGSNEQKAGGKEFECRSVKVESITQNSALKTLNMLKNHQLTIKSSKVSEPEIEDDNKSETETNKDSDFSEDDDETLQSFQNSLKNMKSKMNMNNKPVSQNTSSDMNIPKTVSLSSPKIINKPIISKTSQYDDENSNEKEVNKPFKEREVPQMKHLSQISIKPVKSPNIIIKKRKTIDEEIFSIDDSDSDETCKHAIRKHKQENVTQKMSSQFSVSQLPAKTANTLRNVRKPDFVHDVKDGTFKKEPNSDGCDDDHHADLYGSDEDDGNATAKIPEEQTINPSLAKLMSNKNISFKNKSTPAPQIKHSPPILQLNKTKIDNADKSDLQEGSSDEDNIPSPKQSNNKNIKYLGKDITIKSLKETNSDDDDDFGNSDDIDDDVPFEVNQLMINKLQNMNQNLSIKPNNQNSQIVSSKNMMTKTSTVKSHTRVMKREACESFSQDAEFSEEHTKRAKTVAADGPSNTVARVAQRQGMQSEVRQQKIAASNTVNQEVTKSVKTIKTGTVVEEITTTVTRTIKTVNQSVTQEVSTSGNQISSNSAIRGPNIVQGMRVPMQGRSYQGMPVRHVGPRVRHMTPNRPSRPTISPSIRHANPMPSVRQIAVRQVRPSSPRMPKVQQCRPQNPTIRHPLKTAPRVQMQQANRSRTSEDDMDGCFKLPKQFTASNVNVAGDTAQQVASSSFVRSHSSSTTKTIKSNAGVIATQTQSEVHSAQKHISRLNNMSGLKVVQSSNSECRQVVKQVQNSESSGNRSTLDAIERLQKQGLLVKKPRIEEPPEEEEEHFEQHHSDSEFEDDDQDNTLLAIESGR